MPQSTLSADRLFERPWRPGYPTGRRRSRLRRWGILTLFLLLCSTIFGYLHYTDSARVRAMAQNYLTDMLGGRVEIGGATLSIFEGLRLEDVRVYVDGSDAADSVLFSADTFLIKYDPRVLLSGRLEAEQIIAIDPHVRITENVDEGRWNYQRMIREHRATTAPSGPGRAMTLPEVMLRNAQVDYSEIRNGRYAELGSMAIEGQLTPSTDGKRYHFELQSRGALEGIGPAVVGSFARSTGQVTARLDRFEFGRDIRSMLPAEVRNWWEQHGLAGRVNIPVLNYTPARRGQPAAFNVETELVGVTLNVPPEEWMSREELRRRDGVRWLYETAGALRRGGLGLRTVAAEPIAPTESRGITRRALRRMAGGNLCDQLAALFVLEPIKLQRVSGKFVFVRDGIRDGIDVEVGGRVEDNAFAINGRIDGFSPLAPAKLTISSLRTEHIFIPPAPRYMHSMPRQVQQIYNHLRPQGTCSLFIEVHRPTAGAKPEVSGEIAVVDGSFVFDKFPYPVRKATGRIVFGPDETEGWDKLEIVNLRGLGAAEGPNAQSPITISGAIGPLTGDAGVNVRIEGPSVQSEPALSAAFPPEVREALRIFDPAGTGEQPVFRGGFVCDVIRPPGKHQRWAINTDVTLEEASGTLAFFQYPLRQVRGKLLIRDGHVDIEKLTMQRGDGNLVVDGRVSWKDAAAVPQPGTRQPTVIRPDLTVTARNVPIDAELLAALPEDRRAWLQRLGLGGRLDLDGRVFRRADSGVPHLAGADAASMIDHAFDITLRNGSAWPSDGTFALSDMTGRLRLTSDRLLISEITGRRGEGLIKGSGSISWGGGRPAQIELAAQASNLALDTALYGQLPRGAKQAWDEVRPEGTVDLELRYATAAVSSDQTGQPAATMEPSAAALKLTIRPRELAATLKAVPYRLENIKGTVALDGDAITLTDLTARHGGASIRLSGSGSTRPDSPWDLKLAADDMPVDADFAQAVPEGLASLVESIKMQGKVSFDFSKLIVRTKPRLPDTATAIVTLAEAAPTPTTQPTPVDVDFATRITTSGAALDVGVPLSDVEAAIELAGTVRDGKISALAGVVDGKSMLLAGRPAGDFHAELRRAAGTDRLHIGPIHGRLAGGEISGQVDLDTPQVGPSTYAINLVLRNADVKQIAADVDPNVSGQLSASLALEGNWSDPTARRGRGDVRVDGREMYKVPLVLGLLQVTNLSLPITSPFNEANAAYSVDGARVTFESLSLRSREMLMQGTGSLDFGTKKVRMTFTTDNPNWPKLPIVGAFVQGAKHELLQIHVRGTLTEPKVSARAINTLSTTIDEVLGGDGK